MGLRRALADERSRFAELSEEHADLLALLAQQEVVALTVEAQLKQLDLAAWTQAKRAAEHKCVQRFGLFIATGDEGDEGEDSGYDFGEDEDGEFEEDEVYDEGRGEEGGLQSEFEAVAEEKSEEYGEGGGGEAAAGGAGGGAPSGSGLFGVDDDYGEFDDDLKDL